MEENQRQREIEDLKFKKILEEMELQRKQRELEEKLRHEKENEYMQKKRDLEIQNQEAKKKNLLYEWKRWSYYILMI